jgi:predicted permease
MSVKYNQVAPNYFEVMGTRILRGRPFRAADRAGAAPVAMVNEAMAERFWPGQDALGQNVRVGDEDCEIVAIVENGKINFLHEDAEPFLYFPYAQRPSGDTTLMIATEGNPALTAGSVRQALRDREGSITILGLLTLDEHMRQALYADRLPAQIGGALGVLGVLLAAVGLFGVISRLVNQRRRELGIRMALGARRVSVVKLVLGRGLKLSLAGLAVGVCLALAVGRLMASSLHGVSPADPLALVVACLIVIAVGLAASYLPARRATRVDPMQALRHE